MGKGHWKKGSFKKKLGHSLLSFSTPLVFLSFLGSQFIVTSQRILNCELFYRNSLKYMKCLVM